MLMTPTFLTRQRLDRLINRLLEPLYNVGCVLRAFKLIQDFSGDEWRQLMDVNFMGAVYFTQEALRLMQPGGAIVNVSSIHAFQTTARVAPYAAAKAALNMAVKAYAQQVGSANVRVNAVAPGNVFFPGGSWARKFEDAGKKALFAEYIEREVALRRFATPREIADVVVFLASTRASFVSGAIVAADGGQLRSV